MNEVGEESFAVKVPWKPNCTLPPGGMPALKLMFVAETAEPGLAGSGVPRVGDLSALRDRKTSHHCDHGLVQVSIGAEGAPLARNPKVVDAPVPS